MSSKPKSLCRMRLVTSLTVALLLIAAPARAISITLDYTYDTLGGSGFFAAGNPNGAAAGAQAKSALEAAAGFFSGILNDTFSAIQTPPDFHSSSFNGIAFWDWTQNFTNPTTGGGEEIENPTIPANEYRIFVGARNLGGTTLGIGGPGGYGLSYNNNGGNFSFAEGDQLDVITANFFDSVETRGEATGFSRWGGALSFDSAGTTWHYNHTVSPSGSASDFYSVAIHELGHALGLGGSAEWDDLVSGANFTGAAATAEFGSNPPLNGARDHWATGTMSAIFGTNTPQEAAMDPEVTQGTRKIFTSLDGAALLDIGWELVEPVPSFHPADFNSSGAVNNGDLTTWKAQFGPGSGADADDDGDSDGTDFLIWQRSLGAPPPATAIPEPGAFVLAILAGIAAFMWASLSEARKPVSQKPLH